MKNDAYRRQQEGQSEHNYCTRDSSCVGRDIGRGSWSMSIYHMSMYTNADSCVDRLNIESGRDSASQLMHGDPHLPAFL